MCDHVLTVHEKRASFFFPTVFVCVCMLGHILFQHHFISFLIPIHPNRLSNVYDVSRHVSQIKNWKETNQAKNIPHA